MASYMDPGLVVHCFFMRAGVFFITKLNGNVDVWDLMDRSGATKITSNSCCLWYSL